MENGVVIYEVKSADVAYVEPINRLLAQLSSSPRTFTVEALEAIVQSGNSHLLLAEVDGVVAGMLTLCDYLAPTGRKMWIEDVVVDEAARGKSVGRRLVEHAMAYAASLGGGSLMLTSRPSRIAANRLYRSCGFLPKETNVYVLPVKK